MTNLIERLRGIDTDARTPDELIELRTGARLLEQEYGLQRYSIPDWLKDAGKTLDTELARRRADYIQKRLRELDAQDLAGRTETEKREDRARERERLQAELGTA